MKVVYIAGRFRAKTAWEMAENVREAERWGLEVARRGAMPLIPHANTHLFHGQLTDEFWLAGTLELAIRSDALFLVPGWELSSGVKQERKVVEAMGRPVFEREALDNGHFSAWVAGRWGSS